MPMVKGKAMSYGKNSMPMEKKTIKKTPKKMVVTKKMGKKK